MKKKRLLFVLSVLALFLVACNLSEENQVDASFTGSVEEISGESAVVAIEEGEILTSGDRVAVDLSKADETITVGDQVRVGYEGAVRESYPLQIDTLFVEKIEPQ